MNSPRTTSAARAEWAVIWAGDHAPRCRAPTFATSAGNMHRGLTTSCRQPAWWSTSRDAITALAVRSAALAHLLHARLLLGEVLVEDGLLLGRQHGTDVRVHLVPDRLHLREGRGAITSALHRLANRLQVGVILCLDLGHLRLLRVGELDAVHRAIEAPATAARTTLLGGRLRRSLGAGDCGASSEEG